MSSLKPQCVINIVLGAVANTNFDFWVITLQFKMQVN